MEYTDSELERKLYLENHPAAARFARMVTEIENLQDEVRPCGHASDNEVADLEYQIEELELQLRVAQDEIDELKNELASRDAAQ